MAVAEAGRFIGGNLFDVAEEAFPANSSESPRSFGMEGEETMEGDWFHETPDDERSIPLTETPVSDSRGGYPDYDEFDSDSDVSVELAGNGDGVPAKSCVNGVPANESAVPSNFATNEIPANGNNDSIPANGDGDVIPANGDHNTIPANGNNDTIPAKSPINTPPANGDHNTPPANSPATPSPSLAQLKGNLASRLSYDMTASSCQIWRVFSQLVLALQNALSPAAATLLRDNAIDLRRRFGALVRAQELSIEQVDAAVGTMRAFHPGTGRREAASWSLRRHQGGSQVLVGVSDWLHRRPALRELHSLFASQFSAAQPAQSFSAFIVESFSRGTSPLPSLQPPPPSPSPWRCSNPPCSHLNNGAVSFCEKCLLDRTSQAPLHVVFILHGFKANPQDMRRVLDLVSLSYPHVKCVLLHKCYSNVVQSLDFLAQQVVEEILTAIRSLRTDARPLGRISFMAHSIGGLVFRIAFNSPKLAEFVPLFHLFLSMNVPHLGLMFANLTTEFGVRLIQRFTESIQVSELMLRDQKDLRQTTLYKLAANNGGGRELFSL